MSAAQSVDIERLPNWQIAVLALYSLGGATTRQHGEDLAVKCHELAPRRFGMKRHAFPDTAVARVAVRDAKKAKYGSLVTGDHHGGWLLTGAGLEWCKERAETVGLEQPKSGLSALPEAESREIRVLLRHRLFAEWVDGNAEFRLSEVADALRMPADAPRVAVGRRLEELVASARVAGLDELERFLLWLQLNVAY